MFRVTYLLPDQIAQVRIFKDLGNATSFTTSLSIMNISFMLEEI